MPWCDKPEFERKKYVIKPIPIRYCNRCGKRLDSSNLGKLCPECIEVLKKEAQVRREATDRSLKHSYNKQAAKLYKSKLNKPNYMDLLTERQKRLLNFYLKKQMRMADIAKYEKTTYNTIRQAFFKIKKVCYDPNLPLAIIDKKRGRKPLTTIEKRERAIAKNKANIEKKRIADIKRRKNKAAKKFREKKKREREKKSHYLLVFNYHGSCTIFQTKKEYENFKKEKIASGEYLESDFSKNIFPENKRKVITKVERTDYNKNME